MGSDEKVTDRAELDRRAVVIGGGTTLIGLGLLTAGCGTAAAAPAAPTPMPQPSAASPQGVALGNAAAVPVGGGTVFPAAKVVVTQPQAGTYVGLSAICTHMGCVVRDVSDGTINCPCHGSRYNLDGTVARGPAPRALARRSVTVVDGELRLG